MIQKNEAIAKLKRQIKAIEAISRLPRFSPEFKKWHVTMTIAGNAGRLAFSGVRDLIAQGIRGTDGELA
jgi:hypothetical protein